MRNNPFQTTTPEILENKKLRLPQKGTYKALVKYVQSKNSNEREVGIVLPVGCGKSGCIALAPFAYKAMRTLVIAPSVNIAKQLHDDYFDPSSPNFFYTKCSIIKNEPFPEPAEIRGSTTNKSDLDKADIVISNIQQLQGTDNEWLGKLPNDFFDLILFDEGHHSVAESWNTLKDHFSNASIVNFSATPLRADGQLMAGPVIYSFPIYKAIQEGYIKRLKAVVLNPKTLKYVRQEDSQEIEVELDEVRSLGENDAGFRRSILTSKETLNTIVDASIRELYVLRKNTGEKRLKIIAAALNYDHCTSVVEAYRARRLTVDYVHSKQDGQANEKVMSRLENHELDVIVQVRKLGEGFDHPFLSVAAVFNIFANLSPFVQFVGRIMRVIKQNAPESLLNQGTVVFHAGGNIAKRWEDFQNFSEADQEFFDQLLPLEELDFTSSDELEVVPRENSALNPNQVEVLSQSNVRLEEIPLIKNDPEALAALKLLVKRGYDPDQMKEAYQELKPIPVTKVRERQAKRRKLDEMVKNSVGKALADRKIKNQDMDLDSKRLGKTNFVVLKSALDSQINRLVGRKSGERHDFNSEELDLIYDQFEQLLNNAIKEVIK